MEDLVKFNPENEGLIRRKRQQIEDREFAEMIGSVSEADEATQDMRRAEKRAMDLLLSSRDGGGVSLDAYHAIVAKLAHVSHDVADEAICRVLHWNDHGESHAGNGWHNYPGRNATLQRMHPNIYGA